jgi:hypothetical protein
MAITLTQEFKEKVIEAARERRKLYDGTDGSFAKTLGISASIFSRMTKGEHMGLLKTTQWIMIARDLGITLEDRKWNVARTDVFQMIEEDIQFCKTHSKAKICVDDCGIGKTFTARFLSRTIKNCFYVDASQAKTRQAFIRLIAKTVGGESKGQYFAVKETLKFYLKSLSQPIIVIDEAGDLEYEAFLELKELWNATENCCGWYMMGADGLRAKIERGIANKRVGYAEIFSRYSEKFTTMVPRERQDRNAWYKKLITDVLSANYCAPDQINHIAKRCLSNDSGGNIGGLRRAESLLILSKESES